MKVVDIMSKHVDFVTPDTSLLSVAKLIFGSKINGVPVCKDKKVVGYITEKDILAQFLPSMQEYMEDPLHGGDFEGMEKKVDDILSILANEIMSRNPITITADAPLLKAQSLMSVYKIGRLPVVDERGKLLGILSKGDIFRALVGQKLPFEEDEQFHDWLSKRYDIIIDQKARLSREIPDLVGMFRKLNVKNVLDVGSGTGIHSIALAQEGFEVLGIDRSSRMIDVAQEKTKSLSNDVQQRMKFISKDYKNLDTLLGKKFDAAIIRYVEGWDIMPRLLSGLGYRFVHMLPNQVTIKELSTGREVLKPTERYEISREEWLIRKDLREKANSQKN